MAEYLIFFNDGWVTEATDEQWQQRSRDVRAVVEEMKTAGVFIFTGGLDNERIFQNPAQIPTPDADRAAAARKAV